MRKTSYILRTRGGTPVFSFDDITRARQERDERAKRGINLVVCEVTMTEREMA